MSRELIKIHKLPIEGYMHLNSKLIFEQHCRPYFQPGISVLEFGPGRLPSVYLQLINLWGKVNYACCDGRVEHRLGREVTRVNIDFSTEHPSRRPEPVRLITMAGEYWVQSEDDQFDVCLSGQVMPHVRRPWLFVKQQARLLKPGGHAINISAITWKHAPCPVDGWRILPDGWRVLYEDAGLEPVLLGMFSLDESGMDLHNQLGGGTKMVVDCLAIARKPP